MTLLSSTATCCTALGPKSPLWISPINWNYKRKKLLTSFVHKKGCPRSVTCKCCRNLKMAVNIEDLYFMGILSIKSRKYSLVELRDKKKNILLIYKVCSFVHAILAWCFCFAPVFSLLKRGEGETLSSLKAHLMKPKFQVKILARPQLHRRFNFHFNSSATQSYPCERLHKGDRLFFPIKR